LRGFDDPAINGSYTEDKTHDGYTRYVNNDNPDIIIEYRNEFGPYSFSGQYYIIEKFDIGGAIPIYKPRYYNPSTNAKSNVWIKM